MPIQSMRIISKDLRWFENRASMAAILCFPVRMRRWKWLLSGVQAWTLRSSSSQRTPNRVKKSSPSSLLQKKEFPQSRGPSHDSKPQVHPCRTQPILRQPAADKGLSVLAEQSQRSSTCILCFCDDFHSGTFKLVEGDGYWCTK
jgi:hypothetical protein